MPTEEEFEAAWQKEQKMMQELSYKRTGQVFGDAMIMRDLGEQKRAYNEQAATYKSYKTTDKIMEDVYEARKAAKEAKKTPKVDIDYEKEIRGVYSDETKLSKAMETARAANDKSAYEKAMAATEPLFQKRQELFEKFKKINPKRAEQLLNELYIGDR